MDSTEAPAVPSGTWTITPGESTVTLSIKNLLIKTVEAKLRLADATILVGDDVSATTIEAHIESASFDTGSAKRDEHVKGEDFFDAPNHPNIVFRSTSVARTGDGYNIVGTLQVRTTMSPLTVAVRNVRTVSDATTFTATASVDRKVAGVAKMPSLMIGNNIGVEVNGTARRS